MAEPLTKPIADLAVGSTLPEFVRGPIDRTTLALFAGASHDHVRLHSDSDFAKAAGMNDVFAHGMLTMAYLAQALEGWADYNRLRGWKVRFAAIVPLHATIICRATVLDHLEDEGEARARLAIEAWTDGNVKAIDGEAVIALN